MNPIPTPLYRKDASVVAKAIIGKLLRIRHRDGKETTLIISETEAYSNDASYSALKNKVSKLSTLAGKSWIVKHSAKSYMFNITVGKNNKSGGVLVGAVRMIGDNNTVGTEIQGPRRWTRLYGIDHTYDNLDVTDVNSRISVHNSDYDVEVVSLPRVNVSNDDGRKWRFRLKSLHKKRMMTTTSSKKEKPQRKNKQRRISDIIKELEVCSFRLTNREMLVKAAWRFALDQDYNNPCNVTIRMPYIRSSVQYSMRYKEFEIWQRKGWFKTIPHEKTTGYLTKQLALCMKRDHGRLKELLEILPQQEADDVNLKERIQSLQEIVNKLDRLGLWDVGV